MFVLRWLDANIEKIIILVSYVVMASIIFVEVFRRFIFSQQAAWSSTIPIYLFLWIVWIGCAYNVRIRAHLSFDEVRAKLSRGWQYVCLCLDAALWIVFSLIVIYYTSRQVMISHDNFSIVQGTDNVMQWWFYMATPVGFSLLILRVLQNMWVDWQSYRKGEPLRIQTSIFGD